MFTESIQQEQYAQYMIARKREENMKYNFHKIEKSSCIYMEHTPQVSAVACTGA